MSVTLELVNHVVTVLLLIIPPLLKIFPVHKPLSILLQTFSTYPSRLKRFCTLLRAMPVTCLYHENSKYC